MTAHENVTVRLADDWGVDCRAMALIPLGAGAVWGQMRDFCRFVTLDPFHERVDFGVDAPRSGASFRLVHAFWPIRLVRHGRVLRWSEGIGYAFSDLSARGVHLGFPHVYEYRVEPAGEGTSRLTICVRGRWTMRGCPRWLVRAWLYWVMSLARAAVRTELLAYAVCLARKHPRVCTPGKI
jgi:hypothetical protein